MSSFGYESTENQDTDGEEDDGAGGEENIEGDKAKMEIRTSMKITR